MRAIKFIKNGEEHYIGTVSKEYVDKKEDCKVELFPIPTVWDSIKSLREYLNTYKDEKIGLFIQSGYWGRKHRVITSMSVDYSLDWPFGTIIAEGNDQVMYIEYSTIAWEPDVDTYCDSIVIKDRCNGWHFEGTWWTWSWSTLVATDITDGAPALWTIVRFRGDLPSWSLSSYLSNVSFDSWTTLIPMIYPDSDCWYLHTRGDFQNATWLAFTGIVTDAGLVLIEKCLWEAAE